MSSITHLAPYSGQTRFGLRSYALKGSSGAAERAELAKRDVVLLGMYKGGSWDNPESETYETRAFVVNDLKERNSNIILGDYGNAMETGATSDSGIKCLAEVGPTGNGGTWTPNDWLARKTDGSTFSSFGTSLNTNPTTYVTPDSSGYDYAEWKYRNQLKLLLSPHIGQSGVGPDGINLLMDNMFRRHRSDLVDLDRDGVADGNKTDPFTAQCAAWV